MSDFEYIISPRTGIKYPVERKFYPANIDEHVNFYSFYWDGKDWWTNDTICEKVSIVWYDTGIEVHPASFNQKSCFLLAMKIEDWEVGTFIKLWVREFEEIKNLTSNRLYLDFDDIVKMYGIP